MVRITRVLRATSVLDLANLFISFRPGLRYREPIPLISGDDEGLQWEFQPHRDLYDQIKPALGKHFNAHIEKKLGKSLAPPYFFLSGSGTGKSRNATEFLDTLKKCADEMEMTDLRSRLDNARVFLIGLENGMGIKSRESDLEKAIGSRMLLQLLPEQDLNAVLREYDPPTPTDIFQWVAKGENEDFSREFTGILVLDGIQILQSKPEDSKDKGSPFYRTLNSLCDLSLNRGNAFMISCFTATVAVPVRDFLATTGRPRVYLEVASLEPPTLKEGGSPVFETHPLSRLLVGDCGGHGRALLALKHAIDASGRKVDGTNCDRIMERARGEIEEIYSPILRISAEVFVAVLRAILTRFRLRAEDFIPGTPVLVEDILFPGLIRLEQEGVGPGYLVAPYIWIWILQRVTSGIPDRDGILAAWIFCDYHQLALSLGYSDAQPGNVSWETFENFAASVRVLKSRIFPEGEEVELSRLHAGARLNFPEGIKIVNKQLVLQQATARNGTKSTSHDRVLVRGLSDEGSQGPMEVRIGDGRDCVINGAGAPAGDFWHRAKVVGESAAVSEVGQCKLYSHSAKLSSETFRNERTKSANARDFFILYTTAKDCGGIGLPQRSAIVDGDNWMEYFGPFAGRTYRLRCDAAREELKPGYPQESKNPRKRTDSSGAPASKKQRTLEGGSPSSLNSS